MNKLTSPLPAVDVRQATATLGELSLYVAHLCVDAGTRCAVVGEPGAGKSPLLRILGGLLPVNNGRVHLLGVPVMGAGGDLWRRVVMVPQGFAPTAEMTPHDALLMTIRNTIDIEDSVHQRVQDTLNWAALTSHAHAPIHMLAPAERQRFILAMAYARQPDLLLLDDPFGTLSGTDRQGVRDLLTLRHPGQTVIYTTPTIADAVTSDQLIILQAGKVIAQGSTQEMLRNPELMLFKVNIVGKPDIVYQQLADVAWVAWIEAGQHDDQHEWTVALHDIPNGDSALLRAILADRSLSVTEFCRVRPRLVDILAQLRDVDTDLS